jgi:hypothetical protein
MSHVAERHGAATAPPAAKRSRRARRALAWGAACYLAAQLAFAGVLYDPEYTWRLEVLKTRRAEDPQRPLLLMLGSSRTMMAFWPEILAPLRTETGQEALPFNLSHPASGPVMNLMQIHRLLREGIRPKWLILEIMPAYLAEDPCESLTCTLGPSDLPVLQDYVNPWALYGKYVLERLLTEHRHQQDFVRGHAPAWVLGEKLPPNVGVGTRGGFIVDTAMGLDERERRTALMKQQYYATVQDLVIGPTGDRATRVLLDLCRQQQIQTVLLLAPEAECFRGWYSARTQATLSIYLDKLSREYGAPVVDGRTWVADQDFTDGHHVLRAGSTTFTLRLGRDVLQPLVEGKFYHPAAGGSRLARR